MPRISFYMTPRDWKEHPRMAEVESTIDVFPSLLREELPPMPLKLSEVDSLGFASALEPVAENR
jgi:hypothetical protein